MFLTMTVFKFLLQLGSIIIFLKSYMGNLQNQKKERGKIMMVIEFWAKLVDYILEWERESHEWSNYLDKT